MSSSVSEPQLINIGFQNVLVSSRIIAVINADTSFARRIKEERAENRMLIDATQGRKTRSIIIMDSNHIVLSAMNTETLAHRFSNIKN